MSDDQIKTNENDNVKQHNEQPKKSSRVIVAYAPTANNPQPTVYCTIENDYSSNDECKEYLDCNNEDTRGIQDELDEEQMDAFAKDENACGDDQLEYYERTRY